MYMIAKHMHMTFVTISIIGFIVRGALAIGQHAIMQQRWLRIVPHINDTLLLVSAFYLAWFLQINPLHHSWLLTKIIALLVYIGLGTVVIKRKGSKLLQCLCYFAAVGVFIYIILVAVSKSPVLSGLFS